MTAPTEIERLVRIETKLDGLVQTTGERGIDHETRLRALEKAKWLIVGAATVSGGAAGMIAKALGLG